MATQELTGAPVRSDHTASNVTPFPAVAPGHRLVPALIGTRKNSHLGYIACPLWCVERHDQEPTMPEDITHTSKSAGVGISSFLKPNGDLLMYAMLQADPASDDPRQRQAHIGIETGGMPDYHTPDMADQFADDLIEFALQLRGLARAARLHNQHTAEAVPA